MDFQDSVHLYNVTLQPSTAIHKAILGNFSGTKQQEIVVARNSIVELWRLDTNTGKLQTVLSLNVFGIIRSIVPFRLTGGSKDYIIIGTDSGKITIFDYNPTKNIFEKVHQETFGKTGCRRIVPGEYLAMDPKGRAVMIGAVEKQKLVYILNRDSAARLTISSPLEAHKSHTICFQIVGVDVGFENPIFAALEVDYTDSDTDPSGEAYKAVEKSLVYYELDLGLNHVVRKWADRVDRKANYLIPVPGGVDGPSGVLVCSENYITWRHHGFPALRIPIPRRLDPLSRNRPTLNSDGEVESMGTRGIIIVNSVVHKMKHGFFILAQTEEGDVFKITLDYPKPIDGGSGGVDAIKIKYFDTISVASGLCLMKSGFLFSGSEFSNHHLYLIENLGDDDQDQPEYTSADFPQSDDAFDLSDIVVYFSPRPLRNLSLVFESESLSPIIDSKIYNLTEDDTPQIYSLCGRGAKSTFRVLKHGLEVTEMAVSELPGTPSAVWTVKASMADPYDSYIIVSFINATLVLSIGETVEEVTDTGFLTTTPTILVSQLGDDALLQIYPTGIRHIRSDKRVSEWKSPGSRTIVKAASNGRQVVIALAGGELVYFELDNFGQLNEFQERRTMPSTVTSLALAALPEGRSKTRFLAVGCADNTVRVLSLDADSCLEPVSMQALNAQPDSLLIISLPDTAGTSNVVTSTSYLNIGLSNGVLLRTVMDNVTGVLTDSRLRFLGSRSIKLFRVTIAGNDAVLALSSRPWLVYSFLNRVRVVPLSYEALDWGCSFQSEQCAEGIVSVAQNTLRILLVENLGNAFNQSVVPLKYTPRRFTYHEASKSFVIVESEHGTWCPSEKNVVIEENKTFMGYDENDPNSSFPDPLDVLQFGLPKAEPGKWASCIRVLNPVSGQTSCLIELDDNEAAFSVTTCQFESRPEEIFVVIGTGVDVKLAPRSCTKGALHVYRVNEHGVLELVHVTETDEVPMALCAFKGRLLAGCGNMLRVYELGKKKLLRKCENKQFANVIVGITTHGDRIMISDVQDSIFYAKYRRQENRIIVFADDSTPRFMTCFEKLDYDTVIGGDKFGNLFVNRLPKETSIAIDEDPTGNKLIFDRGYLNGAPHRLETACNYFVGETISSIHKAVMVAGGREVLVYTTFLGKIGLLVPFVVKSDAEFFQQLEIQLREQLPPLSGRDHLAYRSFYLPVRHVVDGDLCEMYHMLPFDKRQAISEELDRTPMEISKKLEDVRNRVAF